MSFGSLSATFLTVTFVLGAASPASPQERPTPEERQEAVRVANQLSARLLETADVAPLIPEFFAQDLLARITPGLCAENVAAAVCRQVGREERLRTHVAVFNLAYLNALDETTWGAVPGEPYEKMLPAETAARLRRTRLRSRGERVETVEQFRDELSSLEQALSDARDYVLRNPVETPQKYHERLSSVEGYMEGGVRVWTAKYVRGEYFDTGLPADERLFVVHTALNLRLLLVKDGDALKALAFMPTRIG